MTGLLKPFAGVHGITQPFVGTFAGEPAGYLAPSKIEGRRAALAGWTPFAHIHLAQDVGMPVGTDLLAPASGRIIIEGTWNDGGHHLSLLIHKDATYQTLIYYNHIKDGGFILPVGTRVKAGQHIAESGASGHVTGPHLHWEVRRGPAGADPHLSSSWRRFAPGACQVGGALAGASWLVSNV